MAQRFKKSWILSLILVNLPLASMSAQDQSVIQIYDGGASDAHTIAAVLETMIPSNHSLAFKINESDGTLIVSAKPDEHQAITKIIFAFDHPVNEVISEVPMHAMSNENGDIFLAYLVAGIDSDVELPPRQIASNFLSQFEKVRLSIDPKTGNLMVLAPASAQFELSKLLFDSKK